MITHSEAKALFKKCRNPERGYKLAGHTYLQKRGHAFVVRLYKTDIAIIRPDGKYRINSGGHRTNTTKNRMNMILPCCVFQQNGLWGIEDCLYADGILIGPDGRVMENRLAFRRVQKIKVRVDSQVRRGIKLFVRNCAIYDMGTWESYGKQSLPCHANKTHLKKVWQIVSEMLVGPCDTNAALQLIRWALLARHYEFPQHVWLIIKNSYLQGHESELLSDNLRLFMRPRKPLIAEMIASGELT